MWLRHSSYSIALPGLGIAVAAALDLGLTKVATVGITICVTDSHQRLYRCSGCRGWGWGMGVGHKCKVF